jgi:thiosulfate dehydrogenase [quinone] large subunit
MKERNVSAEIVSGQQLQNDLQPRSFHIMFLILRIVLGGVMLEAGLNKLMSGNFTISGYVSHGTGPFAVWFTDLAAASNALSPLVMWGEILIGLALILGVLLRFGSFWGAIMMVLYYLPYLPPQNEWISQQIIYMLVFITLIFSGSGYFFGIDRLAINMEKKLPWLRFLLG